MKREPDVPLPRNEGAAEGRAMASCVDAVNCGVESPRCQIATPCHAPIDGASNGGSCRGRGGRHA
jgi:hypothetical protein